jgi:TIGR03009 family protein
MTDRLTWATLVCVCLAASSVWAQTQTQADSWPRPNPIRQSDAGAGPDQPIVPRDPAIERRAAPDATRQYSPQGRAGNQAQPTLPKERLAFPVQNQVGVQAQQQPQKLLPPPFTLTQQEEAQLDRVLTAWEQKSKEIKTFDCSFVRWEYDPIFPKPNSDPNASTYTDKGIIKYAAPDKGVYQVLYTENSEHKDVPIEEERADHWICDGKSVYQYVPRQKQLIEHKLPPEMQGKAIVDGPLPFLFGADAQKLRQRYWIRVIPPPKPEMRDVVCLEAYSRYQQDAANFWKATLMLTLPDMTPKFMEIYQPNRKTHSTYGFYAVVINDPLNFFHGNPFQPFTPRGWEKIVDDPAAQQAGRPGGKAR